MVYDRVKAVINLDNLVSNYHLLKKVNNDKDIYAVVKADAYGHGSVRCASYLEQAGCKHFAVTALSEAIELREGFVTGEVLLFGKTDPLNGEYLNFYDLVQTVDSFEYACKLNELGVKIRAHINIDTGMSRLGIYCQSMANIDKTVSEIKNINELENIVLEGIYTHFTSSDEETDFTNKQKEIFDALLKELKKANIDYGKVHLSNSSGIIKLDNQQYDLARSGIALYGYPPVKAKVDFLPVMEVYAKVIAIREIAADETVSYGRTYQAKQKMKVATVAIGYADGYPRILSNNDYFYFQGLHLPVLGRVCMGLTMVDITDTTVNTGDEVLVFGVNKSLSDMAKRAKTITYELLTNMAKSRVERVYIESDIK